MRSHQGSVFSLVGVGCSCLAASGCFAGAEKWENEQLGSVTQAVLASECVDEAAAIGWSTEVNNACVEPGLWQFPIKFENITHWDDPNETMLRAAMQNWTTATGGLVTWEELPANPPPGSLPNLRVLFMGGGCQSPIGRQGGGVHVVNLWNCGTWSMKHELGHLLGFTHHHQRSDRDRYVDVRQAEFCVNSHNSTCPPQDPLCITKVHFSNSVGYCSPTGSPARQGLLGPFDYTSIMLYGSGSLTGGVCHQFDTTGCSEVKRGTNDYIGAVTNVSWRDAAALIELYRTQEGWGVFRPIYRYDPGPTAPLDTRLRNNVLATGSPTLARWATTGLAMFARGSDLHLYYNTSPGSDEAWTPGNWEDIGGDFSSDPAAVSWAPGRMDVVGVGTDGNVYHKWYANGQWGTGWFSLGKPTTEAVSAPTIASWGSNRLDIFVRAGVTLYQKTWNGAWSAWESRGTAITGKPAAVSWGPNRIDVVARGTNGELWLQPFTGSWRGWHTLGGNVPPEASPAIASGGINLLDVYVKGPAGRVILKRWTGSWLPDVDIGGGSSNDPGAFTHGTGSALAGRKHVAIRQGNNAFDGFWAKYK